MSKSKKYKTMRCTGLRTHSIRGIEYDCCGSILLGVNTESDCDVEVRCRICKKLWNITNMDGELNVSLVPIKEY